MLKKSKYADFAGKCIYFESPIQILFYQPFVNKLQLITNRQKNNYTSELRDRSNAMVPHCTGDSHRDLDPHDGPSPDHFALILRLLLVCGKICTNYYYCYSSCYLAFQGLLAPTTRTRLSYFF